ncbi:MAG: hypothetical protein IJK97_04560, partial [Thermoguttaceae bacterium]|nr:hypothetical protein [Thermoguttaceae bacterium]
MNLNLKMNQTARRTLMVFILTMGTFCAYFMFLVPVLESPIRKTENYDSPTMSSEQESPYAQFFDEGDWERDPDSGHLLKSNNIVMFFEN